MGQSWSSRVGFHHDQQTDRIVAGKCCVKDQPNWRFAGIDSQARIEIQIRIVGFERVGQIAADVKPAKDGVLIGVHNGFTTDITDIKQVGGTGVFAVVVVKVSPDDRGGAADRNS